MRNPIRTRSAVLAIGVFSLSAAALAPGAYAAGSDDVKVSNTETVQVAMDASGKIDAQRVYEQLVLTGKGKVDVANPISTKGLRNLDGFGGYDVRDGAVRIKTDVDGTKKYRSVSDFTKKLPLDIKVTYTLDGKKMDPKDVVGKSGTLEVRYVVTNVTGTTEDVPYTNGEGKTVTSPQEVVVPMVGTLDTTLPSNFTKVVPDGANAAGDGRGGTMLSFTMTLIPPIGKATAEIGYTAKVKDATIPKADISALPVNPLENVSFKGGAEAYKGGAETGQDLTAGATEINANVLKLRDGASDLVAGILKLQDGANQLSAGGGELNAGAAKLRAEGTSEVAAGASKLQKEGTGKLADGADQLNDGAGALSDGLEQAGSKAPALLGGLKTVADGLAQVDAGLTQLNGQVVPGANQISGGAAALISAIDNQLAPGLDQVTGALDQALAVAANVADPTQKAQLTALLSGAKSGVATVKGGLTGSVKTGLAGIKGGGDAISTGVSGATGDGGSLKKGVAALRKGVDQLQDGGAALADGLGELSAGANKLKAGTGDLKSGADTLDGKATELSDGAKTVDGKMGELTAGSSKLSNGLVELKTGLDTAAEGAPALPEGADRLSKEGTSKVVESGNETAMDFGQRYALLEAGAKRATSAQPYGSPEGATALTAYKFEIAGEDGADAANLKRGLAAIALMVAAGGFAAIRRRGLI
ncbi:hypothetical protein [Aeromicrobium ginsengisoli]|uniref:Choice-of-anchor G family protein n=1 Tax=Aeromicrobium ginsengisoli TaxID=363867 RepID=A0A5M4FI89_9ACTN|nr:hypothetical protein [Aeromicrobium ginsengisoli]KAA1399678.1 hypothetical protein ESP70_002645 [Aeromicrobium ginsengisoli]